MVVQIKKIDLTLTSNLTLTLTQYVHAKNVKKTTKKHHCESVEVHGNQGILFWSSATIDFSDTICSSCCR